VTVVVAVLGISAAAVLAFGWFVGERGRYHPSTWDFFRQSGLHWRTLHGYVYARWTPQYIRTLFALPGRGAGAQWLADRYHGKVLTHEHARAVVEVGEPVVVADLEQIVPFPVARELVLDAPADVVLYECVCRHARPAHCEPTQVCMVIGKPMTDFILGHQPGRARRIDKDEALAVLAAEHARGHVHSAWFKDAMLGRFYAICNCCPCCCGGIAMMRSGVRMVAPSGFVADIDRETCVACGECVQACPFGALAIEAGGVTRDRERCMGCGVCETRCAVDAISLVRDDSRGIPLDVRALA
jgi:Pyruvate/2-oxoacid:ferredoxin oxidoreductase delta subunit